MDKPIGIAPEPLGQRIAGLRSNHGWTQAELAQRLAVSRVAVSHFEMGLAVPSERTVILLAGLFKMEPDQLVEGTDYPAAKRERLPASAPRYTEVEFQLGLLERDLEWLGKLEATPTRRRTARELADRWSRRFAELQTETEDPGERELLRGASERLQRALSAELVADSTSL